MGEGIASLGFWIFLASVVIAVSWRKVTTRREVAATVRMAIEKGQQLDPAVVEKMLPRGRGTVGLLVGGAIVLAVGLGLPLMGYFFRLSGEAQLFFQMTGWGIVVSLVGVALLVVHSLLGRPQRRSESEPSGQG